MLAETFGKTISESWALPPGTVGSGYYALMRLDEFAASRIVEAVVHGIDLTDATGRAGIATPRDRGTQLVCSTSCWPGGRWRDAPSTWGTTWRGFELRQDARPMPIPACPSSADTDTAAPRTTSPRRQGPETNGSGTFHAHCAKVSRSETVAPAVRPSAPNTSTE